MVGLWAFEMLSLCPLAVYLNGVVTGTVSSDSSMATINGSGKQRIGVSPGSQKTNASGQAVFAINANGQKGTAVIRFRASGLSKSATVQVKVR